ncbi:hypothetical protein [Mariniflexile sp. AS56]|uniref:hypothetical protein n=1 Tax=Mariniflexile sp. AS56 TaxID=3063957 RepID=UPI0026EA8E0D|nr:hypothetical protein [Mariniflexile sp. AS56]MDO7173729.1 hypothetical protein [Mariniflexile sp. AS56]
MNDTFETIRDNLIRFYIFYIPSSIKTDIQKTSFYDLLLESDYDMIVYLDKDRNLTRELTHSVTFGMMNKTQVLEQNMFLLFDKKKSLPQNEFSYLLDKYLEHLTIHTFIVEWLHTNLSVSVKNVQNDLKYIFEIQAQLFTKHLNHVNTQFKVPVVPETLNKKDVMQHFANNPATENNLSSEPKNVEPKALNSMATKSIIKPKKAKKQLISDAETDAFLLQTVFHVKID